jgi:hypothetical protein
LTVTSEGIVATVERDLIPRDVVDGWASSFQQYLDLAAEICDTDFVPKEYRGQPAAFVACIMTGRELGIGPMTSLKHVQLVKGTATLSAEYKRARILAAGHEMHVIEHTTAVCTVRVRRRGQQWTAPLTYTIEMAKTAKLVKADGAWMTRPRRMLFARVTSELADMYFPDLTMGLPTTELVLDGDWADGEFTGQEIAAEPASATEGAAEGTRTVRRARKPRAPKAEPPELDGNESEAPAVDGGLDLDMDDPQPDDAPAGTAPAEDDGIVDAEIVEDGPAESRGTDLAGPRVLRRIEVLFGEIGISEKDRLAAGTIAFGRRLVKYAGISAEEGGIMIDILGAAAKSEQPKAAFKRLVQARRDERIAAEEGSSDDGPAPEDPF